MIANPRLPTLRGLARAGVLLMFVVVVASAWLRLAQPRSPCADWPGCRHAVLQPAPVAPALLGAAAVSSAVRATHRLAASAVLLLAAALVMLALARAPRHRRAGALAAGMLILALALAALGIVTPGSRAAGVLLGNLLGGQLLFALAWTLAREFADAPAPTRALARWASVAVVPWAAQAALGALAGAGLAPVAPVAHLALALVALPSVFGVGLAAHRQGCRVEGAALMGLAAVQALLGSTAAASAARAALVLAHSAIAALGLALLLGLCLARPRALATPIARRPRPPS